MKDEGVYYCRMMLDVVMLIDRFREVDRCILSLFIYVYFFGNVCNFLRDIFFIGCIFYYDYSLIWFNVKIVNCVFVKIIEYFIKYLNFDL